MTSGPESLYTPEFDSYEWVVGSVRAQFGDALAMQTQNPDFTFVGIPYRDSRIDQPLALFALAPVAEDMSAKVADFFHVAVPIERPDFQDPRLTLGQPGPDDGFILIRHQGSHHYERFVGPGHAEFTRDRHLRTFADQVMTMRPFPLEQRRDGSLFGTLAS